MMMMMMMMMMMSAHLIAFKHLSLYVKVVIFVTVQYSLITFVLDAMTAFRLLFDTLTSCDNDSDLSPIAQLRPAMTSVSRSRCCQCIC